MEFPIVEERTPEQRAEVRARYPDTYFPDPFLEPLWYGRREHSRITDRKAIVDKKSGSVFGICTDQYQVVHYEDLIMMVEEVVSGIDQFGRIEVVPKTLKDGARLLVTIRFPEAQTKIRDKDNIVPKVDVGSSLDFHWRLWGKFGAFQLKCTNGMGVWKTFETFSKRHLVSLIPSEFQDTIIRGMDVFSIQMDKWRKWASTPVSIKTYEEAWPLLPFSTAERERIETLPEIGTGLLLPKALEQKDLMLWSMNSVLTQFATHEVKSEMRKLELELAIARAMDLTFDRVQAKSR